MVNMTNLSNISSLQGIAYYTNNQTDGLLFTGGLIVLYFVALMVLSKNNEPFMNVFAAASWSLFVISLFFWLADLTPSVLTLAFLILSAISGLIMYSSKPSY